MGGAAAGVGRNGTGTVGVNFNGIYEVCVKNDRDYVQSRGMWKGDNPFDFVLPVMLMQIFLFILTSRVVYFLLRPIRTPKFVCSLLAGILLGPSALGRCKTFKKLIYPGVQTQLLYLSSSMAVAYSIFLVATKMDAATNLRFVKRTWKFGLIPFLSCFWVMSGLFLLIPDSFSAYSYMKPEAYILLCVTTSVSFFPVVSESLHELNLVNSELGQIALSSSMLNELIHWIIIAVTTIFKNRNTKHKLEFVLSYFGFILSCVFIIRPAMLMIARSTPPGKPVKECYVVMIQVGVLVIGLISDVLGLAFIQGPLIFGLVMPIGPPLATMVAERTEVIISHFLLPLFFFCIGVRIDVFTIKNWGMITKIQMIVVAGFMTKVIVCMLISLFYQIRLRYGLVLGLMLNIKGIIDLFIFSRLRGLEMMDDQIFIHLVLSSMAVTSIASPLIEILYNPETRIEKFTRFTKRITMTIQNTPRNSELRIVSCIHKEGEVRSIIALLQAFNPSHRNPVYVYVIHLIELLGRSTPILRRIDIHKKKSCRVNYPNTSHIMQAFHNFAQNSGGGGGGDYDGCVTVVPCINVAPYKSMHESICNLAYDKSIPLIILPFHQNVDGGRHRAAATVNENFQDYAPCTVGVLVDERSWLGLSSTSFVSFHVGIFFLGGTDDREALALGMRMSERENMSIVLSRFVLQNEQLTEDDGDDIEERRLDESLIDEFRAMKFGKGHVAFRETAVEGWEKVLDAIRSSKENYDLVIVGKQHKIGEFKDEEMSNFLENAEMLGMLGDMLASTEFCDGVVPVLVVQCGGRRLNRHYRKDPCFGSNSGRYFSKRR